MRKVVEFKFKKHSDLSYFDTGKAEIFLYVKDYPIGYTLVYEDTEQENREYIFLNYEIFYLDTINKHKPYYEK